MKTRHFPYPYENKLFFIILNANSYSKSKCQRGSEPRLTGTKVVPSTAIYIVFFIIKGKRDRVRWGSKIYETLKATGFLKIISRECGKITDPSEAGLVYWLESTTR